MLSAPSVALAGSSTDLLNLSFPENGHGWRAVDYEVSDRGSVVEARVCRVRNGIAADYVDPYMRRRDLDCLVIGDGLPTHKPRFQERFGRPFADVRDATLDWLSEQEPALFPFVAGPPEIGVHAVALAPGNAAFFASRELLTRRGGAWFRCDEVEPARCSLLGFVPTGVMVEGHLVDGGYLRPEVQPEVGKEAYDEGAETLARFFRAQLETYLTPDLEPQGRHIIQACLDGAGVHDYCDLMPGEMFTED